MSQYPISQYPINQYPNSGSLFERVAEGRQPNRTGNMTLGEDLCDYIHQEYRAGRDVILDISAWDKTSAKGLAFISLSIKKPYVKEGAKDAPKKVEDLESDIPF